MPRRATSLKPRATRKMRDAASRSQQLGIAAPAPNRGVSFGSLPWAKLAGYVTMILLVLLMGLPMFWMISGAFKGLIEIRQVPPTWLPEAWTNPFADDAIGFSNFTEAWNTAPFDRFYINTLVITFLGTTGEIFNATLCAYAFAFLKFPKKNVLFLILLMALMIPSQVTTLPNYVFLGNTLRTLGESLGFDGWTGINTYWGIVLPTVSTAYGTFLLRQAFMGLPREVLEAARLDGASHFRLLWGVVIPMAKPVIITYGLISAIAHWNSYLWPLVMTRTVEMRPLTVGIAYLFDTEGNTNYGVVMAATCFVVLPLLLVYLWAQRFIIDGLAAGATKG